MKHFLFLCFSLLFLFPCQSQSIAKQWNEEVLNAIRHDYAKPTVHARNLYHSSILMYDIWAIFNSQSENFFLGKTINGYYCAFNGFSPSTDNTTAIHQAISYAMYRFIKHRYANSPGYWTEIKPSIDNLMNTYNYDTNYQDTNYMSGNAKALGNYIAQEIINYGLQDGANEANNYENEFYNPINQPLVIEEPGNPNLTDPNHWQPLTLETYVDQSGNVIPINTPEFLGAEWGQVDPFALKNEDLTIYSTSDYDFWVYHDPGPPFYI